MSGDYVPYGPEWRALIMRHKKHEIVELLKNNCLKVKSVKELLIWLRACQTHQTVVDKINEWLDNN